MRALAPLLPLLGLTPLFAWAATPSPCMERGSAAETNDCAYELRQRVDDRLQARHDQLQAREGTQQRALHRKQFKAWLETRAQRCEIRTRNVRDTPLGEAHFQDCLRDASEQRLRRINEDAAASCTLRHATRPLGEARCGHGRPDAAPAFDF